MPRLALCFAVMLPLVAVAPARAEVLPSDVALVEDTDGAIIGAAVNPMADGYLQNAACALYKAWPDADPDVLWVYYTGKMPLFSKVQSGVAMRRQVQGIGIGNLNNGGPYCATNKHLKHAVRMGDFDSLPDIPQDMLKDRPELPMPALAMMAHEMGHYWLAYASYKGTDNMQQCDLRVYTPPTDGGGVDTSCGGLSASSFGLHWSAFYNSGGMMFGNHIEDMGDGTFRFYGDGTYKYGPLDQYLMGLRLAEQVPPMLVVHTDSGAIQSADLPLFPGAANEKVVEGYREDVTIQDVIRFEGERVPQADPCHWKGVSVVVYPKGQKPSAARIEQVALYGNAYEAYYSEVTDHRGSIDMTLDGRGTGTDTCVGYPLHPAEDTGGSADEAVSEDVPVAADVPATDLPVAQDPGTGIDVPAIDGPSRDGVVEAVDGAGGDSTGAYCVPGATRCNPVGNGVVQRCASDGMAWETLEDCGTLGKACQEGACTGRPGGGCSSSTLPPGGSPVPWAAAAGLLLAIGCAFGRVRRPGAG